MESTLVPGTQAVAAPSSLKCPSLSEWERVRPLIKQLYVDEDRTLKEVMDTLVRDHGHKATIKQYKVQINKWKLDKTYKEAEARAVLRKKIQRDALGKDSVFRVRGKPVTIENVRRYFKRRGIENPEIEAQDPRVSTPPAIEYWTPLSSPTPGFKSIPVAKKDNVSLRAGLLEDAAVDWSAIILDPTKGNYNTQVYHSMDQHAQILSLSPKAQSLEISRSSLPPRSLLVSQKLFASIKAYYGGAFDSGLFVTDDDGDIIDIKRANGDNDLSQFCYICYTGARLMDFESFVEGRRCFSKASNLVSGLLRSPNPRTLPCILDTFIVLGRKGYIEVVTILRRFAHGLATLLLAETNPLRQIWAQIAALDDSNFERTIMEAWKCICNTLVDYLGLFHATTTFCYIGFLNRLNSSNGSSTQLLHHLLMQGEQALSHSDTRLLDIKFAYGRALYNQNREEEAMAILEEVRVLCKETGNTALEINSLGLLANCQYSTGHIFEAESTLRLAVKKNEAVFGKSNSVTLKLKARLKSWLYEWGRDREAEALNQDNFEATELGDINQGDIGEEDSDKEDIDNDSVKQEAVKTTQPDNTDGDIPRWDMKLSMPATSSNPIYPVSNIYDTTILQTFQGALTSPITLHVKAATGSEEHRENFENDHKTDSPIMTPTPSQQQDVGTEFDMPYPKCGSMSALKTFDDDSVLECSDDLTECSESDHTYSTPSPASDFLGACSVLMDGKQPLKPQRLNLSPLKRTLVERIMEEFWVIFGQQWASNLRTHAGTPSGSSPVAAREAGTTTVSSQHPDSRITNKKRSLGDRDDHKPDEDEDRNPRRPRQSGVRVDDDITAYLACPYRKRDPRTYGITEWKYCALTPYRSIAHLKEHLYRRHMIGVRCSRCWDTFNSQDLLDEHQRMTISCDLQPPRASEGITPSMLTRIKSRKKTHANQTEAEKWGEIYQIFFPGEPIPDPYFDLIQETQVYSPNSQELASYESFSRQELPRVFRGQLEAAATEGTQLLEEKLMGSLVDMIKDCQDRVFQSYQSKFRAQGTAISSPNDMREVDPGSQVSSATPLPAFFQQPPLQGVEYITPDALEVQKQNIVRAPILQSQYSDSGYNSIFSSEPSAKPQNTVQTPKLQSQYPDSGHNSIFSSQSFTETQDHNTGSHSYWCHNCNDSYNCQCHRAVDFNTRRSVILGNAEECVAPVSHLRNEGMRLFNDASDLAPTMETLENYSSNPRGTDDVPPGLEQEALYHDISTWRPNETYTEFPEFPD